MQDLRGIIFMLLAMAGFAVEDSFIKVLSGSFPVSQILITIGSGGCFLFTGLAVCLGHRLFAAEVLSWPFIIRFFSDTFSALFFISAIAMIPLSTASTILQALPIVVTMGAALFLGQKLAGGDGRRSASGLRASSLWSDLALMALSLRPFWRCWGCCSWHHAIWRRGSWMPGFQH